MPYDDSQEQTLNDKRYKDIFKELVAEYIETGEPVGSRTLSKRMSNSLSPATIRNVMADLEEFGIICSEHTSSGRKPTERGWRYFVNTFIEVSMDIQRSFLNDLNISEEIGNTDSIFEKASEILSTLSNCASIILTPTANDKTIQHLDFVSLSHQKILVVIVLEDGSIENRLFELPEEIPPEVLESAANYLNSKFQHQSLSDISSKIREEIDVQKDGLDKAANDLIVKGVEVWSSETDRRLIIKGHSNLLSTSNEIENLKLLFNKLDEKKTIKFLLDEALNSDGIQVFIGSENKAFELSGCSLIVSPYCNSMSNKIVGAIGVIGPKRMQYDKVINLVDCTSKMLSKLI